MPKGMSENIAKSIDEYISWFPKDVQKLLLEMRATIKKAAPEAEEAIKYGIPTFTMKGNLVHFAAFKNHIGFYPTPSAITAFKDQIEGYECSKGTIQFPFSEKLPLKLVSDMVKFRVKEVESKKKSKSTAKV